jgi:hypothetical protein
MLLFVLAILPIWGLLPRSLTPPGTLAGDIRYAVEITACHFGLVLWPCLYFLVQSLLRQRTWGGRLKFTLLMALSLFLAIGATWEVIKFWRGFVG